MTNPDDEIVARLEQRLGRLHAQQRLGIERDEEIRVFGHGMNFFHIENWGMSHQFISTVLKITGLYWRGHKNTRNIQIRHNRIDIPELPKLFNGLTILHISDMHVDMNHAPMHRLIEILHEIDYDLCVLTGDYRGKTTGPIDATLEGMASVCAHLKDPVYAVLGNHDSIRLLPGLEAIGIRMLLNETVCIERDGQNLHLVGVDDAHYYRMENLEKATSGVPSEEISILLSHTPEIYRQAAHAGFNLLLAGHTHGGQICLPGGFPITLDSVLPRHMGAGAWKYNDMQGYTSVGVGSSVVPVRFNCPPEITLHHLHRTIL